MIKSGLRLGRLSTLGTMIGLLCLIAVPGNAQQTFLRDAAALSNLRFVGLEGQGLNVTSILTADDAALLVATDEPRTLNYLISGRLPIRASRLQQLMAWGLLKQEGDGFRSLIPIIRGDRAQRFNDLIAGVAPLIAAESEQAITSLSDRLWRHPGVATLPAVIAWMLRDRVWAHLVGPNGMDFERRLAEQRDAFPERGFWGALWYTQDPVPPAFDVQEWRRKEYAFQIVWNHGSGEPSFGASDSAVPLPQILDKLRSGGRRLADYEDFPGALAAGLVDASGDMRVLAREYDISDEDGLAYLIEAAAVAITEAILRHLPVVALASLLGVPQESAAVIAYTELAPRLVAQFEARGLLVRAGDARAEWRATFETREHDGGPPRRAAVIAAGEAESSDGIPPYSAIIWRDLPRRPILRIAWW